MQNDDARKLPGTARAGDDVQAAMHGNPDALAIDRRLSVEGDALRFLSPALVAVAAACAWIIGGTFGTALSVFFVWVSGYAERSAIARDDRRASLRRFLAAGESERATTLAALLGERER